MFGRFAIRNNIAVWYMDTGDIERAKVALTQLSGGAEKSKSARAKLELALNLGEVALVEGEHETAEAMYQRALVLVTHRHAHYLYNLAQAGLVTSRLGLGKLREAREVGANLPDPPDTWQNDYSLWVEGVSRLLAASGRWEASEALLAHHEENIRDRFPVLWLKLRLFRARAMRRRLGKRFPVSLAAEGLSLSQALGLTWRAAQFERLAVP